MHKGGENKNQYITVRPWGNEQVRIDFNGSSGIAVRESAYTIIKGFEIKGENQSITYEQTIANWWNDEVLYSGTGIRISAGSELTHHIIIKDNIVHDTPAGGIKAGAAAHITLQNNIVYNCAWWTMQGTTGMGITQAKSHEDDTDDSQYYNKIVGNLLFANESRIFSRVWRKGAATLTIDEGEAMLIQEGKAGLDLKDDYSGRYLVKDNYMLYNGKSLVVNVANKVDIKRNSFYLNGTTAMGGSGYTASGLRVNNSTDVRFISNAIEADLDFGLLYSASDTAIDVVIKNSFGYGQVLNAHPLPSGFHQIDQPLFENPQTLDFSIINSVSTKIGAHQEIMDAHKLTLKRYGIQVKPSNYYVDNTQMSNDILANIPGKRVADEVDKEGKTYTPIIDIPADHPSVKDINGTTFKLYLED